MPEDHATRDRIRALVRDVLSKAVPANGESIEKATAPPPTSRFRDIAPRISPGPQAAITRDESSKRVITEDDLRDLEKGSVLRIAEGARLTPLAADIVSERQIKIVHRAPRSGSKTSRMIAV